jgi:hypothetical protein
MKPWIQIFFVVCLPWVIVAGCGSGALATLAPALSQALSHAAQLVKERTGNDLSQYPMTCEDEYDPDTEKLLILCEIDLGKTVTTRSSP